MTNNDSLRRSDITITSGNAPAAPAKMRNATRYQIMYTTRAGERRASRKLYEYALARKLIARLNRSGAHADAYAAPMRVKIPALTE